MKKAIILTNRGPMQWELLEKEAPLATKTFLKLAKNRHFDGMRFADVVPGYLTQTGEAPSHEAKKINTVPLEVGGKNQYNDRGTVSILNHSKGNGRLFISHSRSTTSHLDNKHTIFAKVILGQELLDCITPEDYIEKIWVA